MEIEFSLIAKKDIEFWKKSGNKSIQKKIDAILISILESPEHGIGKPEQLKHGLSGLWSRRIDKEHRIIYEFNDDVIYIHSFKGHYK